MQSLFSLNKELLDILNDLEFNPENEDAKNALAITVDSMAVKIQNYDHFIKVINSQIELANKELERINAFIERKNNLIKTLESTLLQSVLLLGQEQKNGVKKIEIGNITLSTRKSKRTDILNEDIIPDRFIKNTVTLTTDTKKLKELTEILQSKDIEYKIKSEPSKSSIKDAIESGELVDGAEVNTYYSLVIK